MILLQFQLGKSRIVAAPGEKTECSRVASITEQHRCELSIGSGDGQHRHRMVNRSLERFAPGQQRGDLRLAVVATVDGKRGSAGAPSQAGGGQRGQRVADQRDAPRHHQVRVLRHQLDLGCFHRVVVDQIIAQSRSAVAGEISSAIAA